jgi:activator of HSP90 ATPase
VRISFILKARFKVSVSHSDNGRETGQKNLLEEKVKGQQHTIQGEIMKHCRTVEEHKQSVSRWVLRRWEPAKRGW